MDSISIVPYADASHRGQVIALWKAIFGYDAPHNNPATAIDKKLAVNDQLFFVAVKGASVVGTIMTGYDGHRGWIYSVAVSLEHRRSRIGSHLVLHAEQALIDRGCMKINLQILEDNAAVTAFYAALGYATEKRISMGKRIPKNIPPA